MLRQFARQIEELSAADVTSRLASFLVRRAEEAKSASYGGITYIDLGVKKGELASGSALPAKPSLGSAQAQGRRDYQSSGQN